MRIRAARVSLAFALAAAMAIAGAAGPHAGARLLSRPSAGVAASPMHVLAAGLSGLHGHYAHDRLTAGDAVFGSGLLLVLLLVVGLAVRDRRTAIGLAASPAQARGPPPAR